jgi:hypothetical protein
MEYLSLYDYLGKPAGSELGKKVAQAAYQGGIKPQEREISNPKYTGTVLLYPKDFLDFYFRPADVAPDDLDWDFNVGDRQDYDDDLQF